LAKAQPRADIFQNNPLPGPLFSLPPSHLPLVDSITSVPIPQKAASHIRSHISVASGPFHLHITLLSQRFLSCNSLYTFKVCFEPLSDFSQTHLRLSSTPVDLVCHDSSALSRSQNLDKRSSRTSPPLLCTHQNKPSILTRGLSVNTPSQCR
jgi:hypothetical protein